MGIVNGDTNRMVMGKVNFNGDQSRILANPIDKAQDSDE